MRWCLVLLLLGACRSPEYVDVPRAGGGTVRVVKAREPWFKKRRGVVAHGELFESYSATGTSGIYSTTGSQVNIACGPLVVGWSAGNWIYPRGLWSGGDLDEHEHDPGVEVAVTSASELALVDVFDSELDWLAPW